MARERPGHRMHCMRKPAEVPAAGRVARSITGGGLVERRQRSHLVGHVLRIHAGCHALSGCPERLAQAACRGHVELRQRPHRVGHFLPVHGGCYKFSSCLETVTQAACGKHVKLRQRPHLVGHVLQIHAGCYMFSSCPETVAQAGGRGGAARSSEMVEGTLVGCMDTSPGSETVSLCIS
jgi:hypothetical protein